MQMTRRDWLYFVGPSVLMAREKGKSAEIQDRIVQVIRAYEAQGAHRTGTKVDQISGDWLAAEVRQSGLAPTREIFRISRVDPVTALISLNSRRIEGIPLFDGGFTDSTGVSGLLGPLGGDAPVGLTEGAPNTTEAGPLGEARRQNRHRAIILITHGGGVQAFAPAMQTASCILLVRRFCKYRAQKLAGSRRSRSVVRK